VLPVRGEPVTRLALEAAAVVLLLANGVEVRIEGLLRLHPAGGTPVELDPGEDPDLAPLLALRRATVVAGSAHDDGRLELVVAGGALLEVPVDPQYEAWQLVAPGGVRLVSLPGGELAVWEGVA
jgi:hypothetical protein